MPSVSSVRPYAAYPHLHGDLLVFTADNEVWGVPTSGGRARPLTADGARVSHPRISPDGTLLAWTSARCGPPEAYVVALDGGAPRRLTYFGHPRTRVAGWTPRGEVLVLSAQHTHSPLATWVWAVPPDGGPARRLPYGPAGDVAHSPHGEVLLRSVTLLPQAAYWKGYRGGAVGRLWIAGPGEDHDVRFSRFVPEGHGDREASLECPLWVTGREGSRAQAGRIAYLSDAGGRSRLWSSLPDGSDPRPHTPDGAHPAFAARDAASDGTRVVHQGGGDLWLLADTSPDTEPERVDVRLTGARIHRLPYSISAAEWTGDFAAGASGVGCLLEVRGTVHLLSGPGAAPVVLSDRPGVRCRLPRALGSTGGTAWVSDIAGADALEVVAGPGHHLPGAVAGPGPDAPSPPCVLAADRLGRVLELRPSPDGGSLAVAAHDGRVLVVDVGSGKVVELDRSAYEEVTGLAFSPDSAWLAWSHPGPEGLRRIKIARADGGGPVIDATDGRFCDSSPVFTPDGGHIAFVSDRVFDPEYQTHVLDLAFLAARRPFLLTLGGDRPSLLDERGPGGATDGTVPASTSVDVGGLQERIVALPVRAADYSRLTAVDGALLWIRTPATGTIGDRWAETATPPRPCIERWDLRTRTLTTLREGADAYEVTGDGSHMLVRDGRDLLVRAVRPDRAGPAAGAPGEGLDGAPAELTVDLARIRVTVDPAAEWAQAFAEDERLMRENIWCVGLPELGGLPAPDGIPESGGPVESHGLADPSGQSPWARRQPLLERIGSPEEFADLLWDTHGDLGCSHAYVWPRTTTAEAERPGLLGADLARDEDGTWRIARIVPAESSAPGARSPLAAPGMGLRAGDVLLAVDGRPVDPEAGPSPLLWGTADRPVELTVRPASGGPVRSTIVVPLASETALRYHALIRDRRARVREGGGGRLGYLHVPDMVANGWAQLHRDLRAEAGADGLLVDFRENSGGHLSALVLERLARRPVGWQLRRGSRPQSYPALAARGPLVFLADEFSGSDGDNVVAAVRAMGLGPVVGVRTWGGVRGMEVGHSLVDGTRLVHPRGAFWFAHGGWGLENHGVEPDIEVTVAPHERAAGDDPQLDAAIAVALAECERTPPVRSPELPTR
ncbi:PDZ domain-containing protein [Streptomyces sp. NPDC005989]|uniref:S41 family peptidase n=1 Tax=Streptomyces sp. NPDC005989 TaxID=3156727 RepID=UPI0033D8E79D